jgi:hypothetical protein
MTSDAARPTAGPNVDVRTAHLVRRGLVDDPSGLRSPARGRGVGTDRGRELGVDPRGCGSHLYIAPTAKHALGNRDDPTSEAGSSREVVGQSQRRGGDQLDLLGVEEHLAAE